MNLTCACRYLPFIVVGFHAFVKLYGAIPSIPWVPSPNGRGAVRRARVVKGRAGRDGPAPSPRRPRARRRTPSARRDAPALPAARWKSLSGWPMPALGRRAASASSPPPPRGGDDASAIRHRGSRPPARRRNAAQCPRRRRRGAWHRSTSSAGHGRGNGRARGSRRAQAASPVSTNCPVLPVHLGEPLGEAGRHDDEADPQRRQQAFGEGAEIEHAAGPVQPCKRRDRPAAILELAVVIVLDDVGAASGWPARSIPGGGPAPSRAPVGY